MLKRIVHLIASSEHTIEGNTIFIKEHIVEDVECLEYLEENRVLETPLTNKQIGATINIELSIAFLVSLGFYAMSRTFITKNRYEEPKDDYYILEISNYKETDNSFIRKYRTILGLINAIESSAKHSFTEIDTKNIVIYAEGKSLLIPFIYDELTVDIIYDELIESINATKSIINSNNNEKRLIFINQLIDQAQEYDEETRFALLLKEFKSYYDKSESAYQYYLRDFSFNKLKIELDNKALEYTQKIQGVINDSQTKLIAIPTAFVLVFSSFDYTELTSSKNITSIISLFIFAVIIQLFLNNQFSVLRFIEDNVESYKETFKNLNIESVSTKFNLVGKELLNQKRRFRIVQWILWVIPCTLLIIWLYLLFCLNKDGTRNSDEPIFKLTSFALCA